MFECVPFVWKPGNSGKNSNGTVHPGRNFMEKSNTFRGITFFPFLVEGDRGGGSPGEQGAGGVRETGEERAGGGISTMAGSGREIQKGSQRNEPNNVS